MKVSKLTYHDLSQEIVDKILFENIEDEQLTGDCMMVLGSKTAVKYRLPKALEIYNTQRSDKILLSGGKMIETKYGNISEAENMNKELLEKGIPPKDIIVENTSQSTKENFICSLLSLERALKLNNIKRILLITTRYHMKRSMLMAASFMPKWINISPCPADDTNTLRHNWFLFDKNKKLAIDEAYKISCYIREGSIQDFDI